MKILVGVGLVAGVATLDLIAFVLAKEWTEGRGAWLFWLGLAVNTAIFALFARSLGILDPVAVSFGWIALFQLGVVLIDRFRYGVALGAGRVAAVSVMVLLEAYLILGGPRTPA
jgi:hypothetical protein